MTTYESLMEKIRLSDNCLTWLDLLKQSEWKIRSLGGREDDKEFWGDVEADFDQRVDHASRYLGCGRKP